MKRGDVVLIVAQGDIGKPRPAVIVQADELGGETGAVLVCPMSSDIADFKLTRPVVQPDQFNGLHFPSQIMTDKLSAIPRSRVRQVIGVIDQNTSDQLNGALLMVLGLSR
ncbi:type II toxin-antitoxin system PemK/MazF family toxin [Tardiphaga sp.]|uniref:type II toxin-antitoxin system PemK/MazF family toxin n=1 Tax=Tardiphaga sp. TaxID=1926292 RepID=UPI0037DA287E